MTGDCPHLLMFRDYVQQHGTAEQKEYSHLSLPTLETKDLFVDFMYSFKGAKFGDFLSRQHKGMIPDPFKMKEKGNDAKGIDAFMSFIDSYAGEDDNIGMKMIDRMLSSGKYRDRALMVDALSKELGASALVNSNEDTQWMAHRVLADVEMVVLYIFGEVTCVLQHSRYRPIPVTNRTI